jgi:hypothetical protein
MPARSNDQWRDHQARVLVTAGLIAWYAPATIIDPACGDASIAKAAYSLHPFRYGVLADINPANALRQLSLPCGDVYTSDALAALEIGSPGAGWDVVILTEILEHLEDPEALLRKARDRGAHLVASSPVEEPSHAKNPEHLWSFGVDGYRDMLVATGWKPDTMIELSFTEPGWPYRFQIWGCS